MIACISGITINIIADGFLPNDGVHSEYVLQEKAAHTLLTDVLEIHFLDLQAAKRVKEENKPKSLIKLAEVYRNKR